MYTDFSYDSYRPTMFSDLLKHALFLSRSYLYNHRKPDKLILGLIIAEHATSTSNTATTVMVLPATASMLNPLNLNKGSAKETGTSYTASIEETGA